MKSSEVRNTFINYFKKNGHAEVASSSLIPENDPTLLFANAGMNQFKNLFLGLEERNYSRAVSAQKCVRAGGKHNDLDNVGFTARHHTFFEMLGNFSFGDYFKKDAIHFAWELLTKDLAIPKDKLYVTVFETDDEAADIWHKQEGVPKDRIFRLGEKDNFWRMGDTGPCGPCTEIFFDHGPLGGKESDPFKGIQAGEDRFVEIWNLVFMQFFESAPGKMSPLPKPSVDTGGGLERMVAALQGRYNNYNTDLFTGLIESVCKQMKWDLEQMIQDEIQVRKQLFEGKKLHEIFVSGAAHESKISAVELNNRLSALRVLADHTRSTSFLIADGALPSNEGRGYVLRRIMRRAIRYGRKISESHSFLPMMSEALIRQMSAAYPELNQRQNLILSTIKDEETRFLQTLDQGTLILNEEIKKAGSKNVLSGEVVFKLYDTFGFPADLTALIAHEKGFTVDEAGFQKQMEAARSKAKSSWKGKGLQANEAHLIAITQKISQKEGPTQFTGYESSGEQGAYRGEGEVLLISNGEQEVNSLKAGETGLVIFNRTPFYAEGGGQAGDKGLIKSTQGDLQVQVFNCTKNFDVHVLHIEVLKGELTLNKTLIGEVSESERRNTMSNHSATHLMHAALKKVLGSHVTQAGSLVDAQRTRFDFSHNKPVSKEEIAQIEQLVNAQIGKSQKVDVQVMAHKEAIAKGAVALFGEKYGDQVRVLTMGDFSCELCGGTHVSNTSQIRFFKIISESGVSAGVRRIEAITGDRAIEYANKSIHELESVLTELNLGKSYPYLQALEENSSASTALVQIETLKKEVQRLEKEIKKAKGSQINLEELLKQANSIETSQGPAKVIFADLDIDDRDVLSQTSDQLRDKAQRGIVVLVGKGDSSHPILVSVSKDLTKEYSAGTILKELAQLMGGKGGGRPDFAQGAVPNRQNIKEAYAKLSEMTKAK